MGLFVQIDEISFFSFVKKKLIALVGSNNVQSQHIVGKLTRAV